MSQVDNHRYNRQMGIREDSIWDAIENMEGNEFERFAFRILYEELYPGLNPTSPTYDFGEDARTEWTTLFLHNGKWISVSASKTPELSKLKDDCQTAKGKGRRIDIIVFATAGKVRRDQEEKWREEIKTEFGWDLVVHSLYYFALVAASDKHASLVDDYLQIPPPGGDFLYKIEAEFGRLTAQALGASILSIEGLDKPLARDEVSTIEDQLKAGKQVLLTGEAGTGKSGIGAMLARAAQAEGRGVLLLDARRVGHIKSEYDFRKHFNINSAVEDAIDRVAHKRGCRIIIDQFDNAVGTLAADHLTALAKASCQIVNTETIVISRKIEYHERAALEDLRVAGFIDLFSQPLTEVKVADVLEQLGISDASSELVDLCRNLLNLSLVATIKKKQPDYDFTATLNEIDLWEGFIAALVKKEGIGPQPNLGEQVIIEAEILAKEGLKRDDRSVLLDNSRSLIHQRLVSWQILILEEGDIHHFRHGRLQDFLVARWATKQGVLPSEILREFDKHRTLGVFAWMDKLYARRPDSARRAKFLNELFTSSDMPFYTQAAVLQRYIHSSEPEADSVALAIIVEALRTEKGLRSYFFRSRPDPQWAPILWDEGFFDEPPPPQPFGDHHLLAQWDAQNYLFSIAADVPSLLIKHIKRLLGDSGYAEGAVRALRLIPSEETEQAVPRVLEWMADYRIGQTLAGAVVELIKHLVAEKRNGPALDLFRALMLPHPSPHAQEISGHIFSGEAVALFSSSGGFAHKELPELVRLLAGEGRERMVSILEGSLLEAIQIEAQTRRLSHEYVWDLGNNPFAATRAFGRDDYKSILLRMLHETLEEWIENDASAVEPLIEKYLCESRSALESRSILRRLAVYLLQKYASHYRNLVRQELLDPESLNTLDAKNEFLLLLRNGHQYLNPQEQDVLITRISWGLPPGVKGQFGNESEQGEVAEHDLYLRHFEKRWIRDYLAMLRDCLPEEPTRLLTELIQEVGEPTTPDSPRVLYQSDYVSEVSPLTKERLASMSPDALVDFVRNWQPELDEHERARTTYESLADIVAEEMLLNPDKYDDAINDVATVRYQFAASLIIRLTNTERYPLSWEGRIALCENLLADEVIPTDMSDTINDGWRGVRLSVVRLIATWLDKRLLPKPKEYLPPEYLPRVRDLLLILCDDPDPDRIGDEELKDERYERNVSLIAHGHVRSSALSTLIIYAVYKTTLEHQLSKYSAPMVVEDSSRMETVVREVLTRKLDRESDPSCAVHSVYGEHLSTLRWLDSEWTNDQLECIFPETGGEHLKWCYVAAWDSYLKDNHAVDLDLFEKMRERYARAIENLCTGWITKTSPQPARDLAYHVIVDYLHADYDLRAEEGQQSLTADFFRNLPPLARGDGAWVLWDICNNNRDRLDLYWKRALALWQWRVAEASGANHSADFDDELNWFTLLLRLAQERAETISSMWPLLEGSLPHVARTEPRSTGWDMIKEYLAKEVERDALRAIKLYYLMLAERKDSLEMYYPREEGHKIVRIASACQDSKHEALEMINFLARHGNYCFQGYIDVTTPQII